MGGSLAGLVTLFTQWEHIGYDIFSRRRSHVASAAATAATTTTTRAHSTGGQAEAVRVVVDIVEGVSFMVSSDDSQCPLMTLTDKSWKCRCEHCKKHRRVSEAAAAEQVAAQAAEAFAVATSSCGDGHKLPRKVQEIRRSSRPKESLGSKSGQVPSFILETE